MTNTCILVSLYFDKNIGLSTPNLPTSQAQPMFPIVYHTELTGSYALNGSISLNMPSSVTAYPDIKTRKDDSPVHQANAQQPNYRLLLKVKQLCSFFFF